MSKRFDIFAWRDELIGVEAPPVAPLLDCRPAYRQQPKRRRNRLFFLPWMAGAIAGIAMSHLLLHVSNTPASDAAPKPQKKPESAWVIFDCPNCNARLHVDKDGPYHWAP